MDTQTNETRISNRDKFVLAKAWVEGTVIPGIRLKPGQACAKVGLKPQTYWWHLRKEKGGTADTDTSNKSPKHEDSDLTVSNIVHQESSPSAAETALD